MKDMTLCVVCVILGMLLATMFKQVCGCKNIIEGVKTLPLIDAEPLPPQKKATPPLWKPRV